MKWKLIAAAVALTVAGSANATLTGLSNSQTGSSLWLTVWGVSAAGDQKTYVRDLGLTLADFAVDPNAISSGLKSSFLNPNYSFDNPAPVGSNFSDFFSGVGSVNWSVTAGRITSTGQLLTTLSTPNLPVTYGTAPWNSLSLKADAWIGQMNALGTGTEVENTGGALNNANVATSWGVSLGNTLGSGRTQNGVGFATLGYSDPTAVSFFQLGQRANNSTNSPIVDSVNGSAFKFWLTSDGTLFGSYATAPVPEPGTYALLGAGLLIMGGIARRRLG